MQVQTNEVNDTTYGTGDTSLFVANSEASTSVDDTHTTTSGEGENSEAVDKTKADTTKKQKGRTTPKDAEEENRIAREVVEKAKKLGKAEKEGLDEFAEFAFRKCHTFPESEHDPPKKRAALKIFNDQVGRDVPGVKKSSLFDSIARARQRRWCEARGVDISNLPDTHQTGLTRMHENDPAKLDFIKEILARPTLSSRELAKLVRVRKAPAKSRRKSQKPSEIQTSPPTETTIPLVGSTATASPTMADIKQLLETLVSILARWDGQSLEQNQDISASDKEQVNVRDFLPPMRSLLAKLEQVDEETSNSKRLENANKEHEEAGLEISTI